MKYKKKYVTDKLIHILFMICSLCSVFVTIGIVGVLFFEGSHFFKQVSLYNFIFDTQWTPLFSEKHFGIAPLLSGTFLVTAISLLFALPCGIIIAIFLSEFCSPRLRNIIKPSLELLAGIPTVVYGYFALITVTPWIQKFFPEMGGFNALSPGLVMGVMILPMVASLSEDALYAVPRTYKEAAYALGCSKLEMVFGVLVPSAWSGIVSASILAVSRAVGETMIVAVAAGQQPKLTLNPFDAVETMTAYIVQVCLGDTPHGTLEYYTIFAVAAALFLITFAFNILGMYVRGRKEVY